MTTDQNRISYLLRQFSINEASEAEFDELCDLIMVDENESAFKMHLQADLLAADFAEVDQAKLDELLRRVLPQEEVPVVPMRRRWTGWVAAAAVLMFIVAGLWFLAGRKDGDQPGVAVVPKSTELMPPQSARAQVTLVNGQVVYLDSVENGMLAEQDGVELVKTADGKVIYQSSFAKAPADRPIAYNTLTNPRGSKVIDMTLADGSHVWLNAGSSVKFPVAFAGDERRVEITGEAYFEIAPAFAKATAGAAASKSSAGAASKATAGGVAPKASAGGVGHKIPFIVAKGDMEVRVLGTHFNVNAYDDENEIKVTLLEGSVEVSSFARASANRVKVKIKPGEQAIVSPVIAGAAKQQPINLLRPDLEATMAWKNGRFQFGGATIQTIMKEVSRYYDAEIIYQDNIAGQFVADISRDVPVSKLLHILELTNRVKFKVEGKRIVVMK